METLYRKLSELDLSIRTKNILKNAGIETLQDLTNYTRSDLIKFRNFGKRSIMELEELMLSNNLNFIPNSIICNIGTKRLIKIFSYLLSYKHISFIRTLS